MDKKVTLKFFNLIFNLNIFKGGHTKWTQKVILKFFNLHFLI